jgi:S-adenosylmethionine synthetase
MFGYAINETEELVHAPIQYSQAILRKLAEARKSGTVSTLGPDAKSQLTAKYENGKPAGDTSIFLSTRHLDPSLSSTVVQAIVVPYIIEFVPDGWVTSKTE